MSEEKINFEKEMQHLDEIVNKISSQNLPLDECLALYQEGQKIIKNLEKALESAKEKVETVIKTN
jgi:exodeoxyribonuclease VII small subunit